MELDVGQAVVLAPGPGDKLLLDDLFVSVMEATMDVEPHVHREHVDSFYVLEGTFTFDCSGEEVALGAGDYAVAPVLLVHGFRPGNAVVLNVHAPGRFWVRTRIARREGRRLEPAEYDSHDPPPDGGLPRAEAIVRRAGEGEALQGPNHTVHVKAVLPELCVFESDLGPGWVGPTAHLHRAHVDAFFVLDGMLELELDGEKHAVGRGGFVAVPPGVVHTFHNPGEARVRLLNLHAPGVRFDEYIRGLHTGEGGRRFREAFDVYEVEVT
jgi:mannose-6-phosphate isomerase-like protein (cupin superfamily)